MVNRDSFKGVCSRGKGMENSVRPSTSELESLAFGTTFDVLFDIAILSSPVVTIKVTDGLSNTRVS